MNGNYRPMTIAEANIEAPITSEHSDGLDESGHSLQWSEDDTKVTGKPPLKLPSRDSSFGGTDETHRRASSESFSSLTHYSKHPPAERHIGRNKSFTSSLEDRWKIRSHSPRASSPINSIGGSGEESFAEKQKVVESIILNIKNLKVNNREELNVTNTTSYKLNYRDKSSSKSKLEKELKNVLEKRDNIMKNKETSDKTLNEHDIKTWNKINGIRANYTQSNNSHSSIGKIGYKSSESCDSVAMSYPKSKSQIISKYQPVNESFFTTDSLIESPPIRPPRKRRKAKKPKAPPPPIPSPKPTVFTVNKENEYYSKSMSLMDLQNCKGTSTSLYGTANYSGLLPSPKDYPSLTFLPPVTYRSTSSKSRDKKPTTCEGRNVRFSLDESSLCNLSRTSPPAEDDPEMLQAPKKPPRTFAHDIYRSLNSKASCQRLEDLYSRPIKPKKQTTTVGERPQVAPKPPSLINSYRNSVTPPTLERKAPKEVSRQNPLRMSMKRLRQGSIDVAEAKGAAIWKKLRLKVPKDAVTVDRRKSFSDEMLYKHHKSSSGVSEPVYATPQRQKMQEENLSQELHYMCSPLLFDGNPTFSRQIHHSTQHAVSQQNITKEQTDTDDGLKTDYNETDKKASLLLGLKQELRQSCRFLQKKLKSGNKN